MAEKLANSWSPPKEFPLVEFTPWLMKNKGPGASKGVIYFIAGWGGLATSDKFHIAPYILKSLNDAGWDVVGAKFPENFSYYANPKLPMLADVAAPFVQKRISDLKSEGYRKVVVYGQSWGAWVGMLSEHGGPRAYALVMSAPAIYGRKSLINGGPNPRFRKNFTEFGPALNGVKTPTILALYAGDEYESGDRGAAANKILSANKVPHLVIDKPPGFSSHYAGWVPFFDFAYGDCIGAFFEKPQSDGCWLPLISNGDFRSILNIKQVKDAESKRIVSSDSLNGRRFVAYTLRDVDNKHFDYVSPTQRVTMETDQEMRENVAFRDQKFCIGKACSILIKWSENDVLEFEPSNGRLKAWWIEDK